RILVHLRELPQPQSAALAGALGLASSTGSDRLLISAAGLGLLAAAGGGRPGVCVIREAPWGGPAPARAPGFARPPLPSPRAARGRGWGGGGGRDLGGTGFDPPTAAAVLAAGGCSAAGEVLDRLLAEAGGNPLALLELPHGLSRAQLEGQAALPDAIPLSPQL